MPELVLHPSPKLRLLSVEIDRFDEELRLLVQEMRSVMVANNGIGLAAPQIGVLKRVILVGKFTMINPVIDWMSTATSVMNEGCLSIPGQKIGVERPSRVDVSFYDISGLKKSLKLGETMAKVVQHEIDHLNGRLIIDYDAKLQIAS
jgi:peptide deformylase